MFDMFKENNGGVSSVRVIAFMIVAAVLFVWVSVSLKTWTIQPLDMNTVVMVLGSLGAKVGQKFAEKP